MDLCGVTKERRKSMPPNMKMPIIKVTPSSPSPDPNHPDYPEFFEDRLYLEHVSKTLTKGQTEESLKLVLETSDEDDSMSETTLPMANPTITMRKQQSLFRNSIDTE